MLEVPVEAGGLLGGGRGVWNTRVENESKPPQSCKQAGVERTGARVHLDYHPVSTDGLGIRPERHNGSQQIFLELSVIYPTLVVEAERRRLRGHLQEAELATYVGGVLGHLNADAFTVLRLRLVWNWKCGGRSSAFTVHPPIIVKVRARLLVTSVGTGDQGS